MAKQTEPNGAPQRKAASSYPCNTLQQCIRLGLAVFQAGGTSGPVSKAFLAERLGVGETSSGFYSLVASCKTFGIVDGLRDLALTEPGSQYFAPSSDAERRRAELSFFRSPGAFRILIERYDGHSLPDSGAMGNVLLRSLSVPKSWCQRVATIFLGAAQDLRIVDPGGFLRLASAEHQLDARPRNIVLQADAGRFSVTGGDAASGTPPTPAPSPSTAREEEPPIGNQNVWVYREAGGVVRLETPDPLPRALWDRLTKYVRMLEPSNDQ